MNNSVGSGKFTKYLLIGLAGFFAGIFLLIPIIAIFYQAFAEGILHYFSSLATKDTLHAIGLTLFVALLTLPINLVFGTFLAWLLTRFNFYGRKFIMVLIDIPFAVSPVVVGLLYLLLYGNNGWLGAHLEAANVQIMFAAPGILLVTIFVTSPFVARELIPLMQQQGKEEEEAAVILGASGWKMFRKVTLPNIKWALIYGVILTNARAVGEFGAVSVVSGNIRGETNTLSLNVELLYQDYQAAAAFASASLLALIALFTLLLKAYVEHKQRRLDN